MVSSAKFSSIYPGGGELPKAYSNMLDPFVSLMAAAGATTSLKLGTGVCLVLERDLLALAKEVATLDVLSGGRVLLGVGVGWNKEELANHQPADRPKTQAAALPPLRSRSSPSVSRPRPGWSLIVMTASTALCWLLRTRNSMKATTPLPSGSLRTHDR